MNRRLADRAAIVHVALIALLFGLQFVLSDYHHLTLARVMVLATFAVGYNVLFGYTGLLSLGHAMFFAAGLYGAGLTAYHLGWEAPAAFVAGLAGGAIFAFLVGLVALRTTGVAFMIVTMMFAQACYLLILYFGEYTRGDEGFTLLPASRSFGFLGASIDLADAALRYNLALALMAVAIAVTFLIVRAPVGRVLVAVRENEHRATMLGYNVFRYKLFAVVVSGTFSAAAGAAYALLFAYVGATFASIQYSIYALLWTLLGGAGTVLGPVVGAATFMILEEILWANFLDYNRAILGAVTVLLILFLPGGLLRIDYRSLLARLGLRRAGAAA
jgi:branched-chain amino acid transport system permease protein